MNRETNTWAAVFCEIKVVAYGAQENPQHLSVYVNDLNITIDYSTKPPARIVEPLLLVC